MFRFMCVLIFISGACLASCTINKNMLFINSGTYVPLFKELNNTDEVHQVSSFFIDKYSVNNLNFLAFVLNNPFWDFNNVRSVFCDNEYLIHWRIVDDLNDLIYIPIVNISWFSANSYCEFMFSRLPYIDEWEYASQLEKLMFIDKKFNGASDVLNWYIKTKSADSFNVYKMPCNLVGVCGMHGFIWEWVQDFSSVILINSDAEGGGLEELLYCGGTAISAIDPADYVAFMRFSFRNTLEANYCMNKMGFRCVKDVS